MMRAESIWSSFSMSNASNSYSHVACIEELLHIFTFTHLRHSTFILHIPQHVYLITQYLNETIFNRIIFKQNSWIRSSLHTTRFSYNQILSTLAIMFAHFLYKAGNDSYNYIKDRANFHSEENRRSINIILIHGRYADVMRGGERVSLKSRLITTRARYRAFPPASGRRQQRFPLSFRRKW